LQGQCDDHPLTVNCCRVVHRWGDAARMFRSSASCSVLPPHGMTPHRLKSAPKANPHGTANRLSLPSPSGMFMPSVHPDTWAQAAQTGAKNRCAETKNNAVNCCCCCCALFSHPYARLSTRPAAIRRIHRCSLAFPSPVVSLASGLPDSQRNPRRAVGCLLPSAALPSDPRSPPPPPRETAFFVDAARS